MEGFLALACGQVTSTLGICWKLCSVLRSTLMPVTVPPAGPSCGISAWCMSQGGIAACSFQLQDLVLKGVNGVATNRDWRTKLSKE